MSSCVSPKGRHRHRIARRLADVGRRRRAANGSVINPRNRMRNSESPKLCSNSPAASIATMAATPPAARARAGPRRNCADEPDRGRHDEPRATRERRQAALGGELHGHVVQMRACVVRLVLGIDGVGRLVFLDVRLRHHVRPDAVHGWSAIIALPDLSIAMRSRLVASFGSNDRQRALPDAGRRDEHEEHDERPARRRAASSCAAEQAA